MVMDSIFSSLKSPLCVNRNLFFFPQIGTFQVPFISLSPSTVSLRALISFRSRKRHFLQIQGNRRHFAEAYSCKPHKRFRQLMPTCPEAGGELRKRAIYRRKLACHRFSGMPLRVRVVTKLIEYEKHAMLIARRLCEKPAKFLLVFVIGIANRNQCRLAKVYL
jgi:hypothetical protein